MSVPIGGDRSPRHLAERLDALERTLPRTRRLLMHGQGHGANDQAPVVALAQVRISASLPAPGWRITPSMSAAVTSLPVRAALQRPGASIRTH